MMKVNDRVTLAVSDTYHAVLKLLAAVWVE